MKNLKDLIKENFITKDNTQDNVSTVNESKTNEKLFWKWIDALGGESMIEEINDEEDGEPLYKKASELGTTTKQFEEFSDYFFKLSSNILDIIFDNDDISFGSDDSNQYASWTAPFYGEKMYKEALKNHDTIYKICDKYAGEEVGYAMEVNMYEDYINDNELNPKGFK